ncbi:class I SAM-dependent methyltransferase [Streptomyces meridianus]|uniref:Class I SAM-dependent methyltransferase n=1 Tax=Streptomyces meridianus TaxID=2938945 RepID=A0ABT0XDM0_9ACTN|nr:class I SAM-dependent methyltransferase [Streptomyces meridianus]MCM2580629.1 class I SAM-dependent methyltransferase [Streptomyces meridianus]
MPGEFGREFWEERHRTRSAGHGGPPHPHLVAEAGRLAPGTALDAGCGEGAEAVWLASRGWRVTAVDIAATALHRAREHAASFGAEVAGRIAWVRADLTVRTPSAGGFDLVTTHYAHPRTSHADLIRSLAEAVAPGGSLVVVGHHPPAPGNTDPHTGAPEAHITAEEVVTCLDPGLWDVTVAEARARPVKGHDGHEAALHDTVVSARRRHARQGHDTAAERWSPAAGDACSAYPATGAGQVRRGRTLRPVRPVRRPATRPE